MKRFATALTALALTTAAVVPAAYAADSLVNLRQENLDKDAANVDQLRRKNPGKDEIAPDELKGTNFDELRRENLDQDAARPDALR